MRAATRIATRPVFSPPAAATRLKPVGIGSVGRPRLIPGGVEARLTAESGGGGSQSFRQVSGMFPADWGETSGIKSVPFAVLFKVAVGSLLSC